MKNILFKLFILSLVFLLSACSFLKIGWVVTNVPGNMTASYIFFNGTEVGTVDLAAGEILDLEYDATVNSGSLSIAVANPNGKVVWQAQIENGRNENVKIAAGPAGQYTILVTGKNTRGRFAVEWTKEVVRSPGKVVDEFYDWYLNTLHNPALSGSVLNNRLYRSSKFLAPEFIQKVDTLLNTFESNGPGYDPFLCAQNVPPTLTAEEAVLSGDDASVQVGYQSLAFTVSLARSDGEWKIADIACAF